MDTVTKVAAFLVVLGVLVVFHELGHYAVARWCRVKVLRFSVGFGRVVWSRRFGPDRTEWAISAIPLGGYVKMVDEREGAVAPADLPRAFNRQTVGKRIAIVAAGPIANLLLAVLLFAGTFVAGIPGQRALLAGPPANTPAAVAGIREGDLVVSVDGARVRSWQDLRWRLLRASGAADVVIGVERPDGARLARTLSLAAVNGAEWEGNFMPALGLRSDFGAPLIDEALPDKPAARAGMRAGDRIVAIDGEAVRSPAEVAAKTNAHPGAAVTFRISRDGAERDVTLTTDIAEQAGRKVGIAGIRLKVDPAFADRLAVTVRYGVFEALGAGNAQDLGALGVHGAHAGPDSHRRSLAQEHQRTDHDGRLRGPVGAGGNARLRRLSRAHQHQSRRAQSAPGSTVGWGAFAVLFRRNHQRQSRLRPRLRGRPAHRHGHAGGADGVGALQ